MSETDVKQEADFSPFAELFDDLYAECDGLLESARGNLLALEAGCVGKEHVDQALLNALFRCFHTLKGLAGMAKMHKAELLVHQLENYLRTLRQGRVTLSKPGMEALTTGVDALEEVIAAYRAQGSIPDIASITELLNAAAESAPFSQDGTDDIQQTWRFEFTPSSELAQRGINVNSVRERLTGIGKLLQANPCMTGDDGLSFEFIVAACADAPDVGGWEADGVCCAPYDAQDSISTDANKALSATEPENTLEKEESEKKSAPLSAAPNTVRVNMAHMDELMRIMGELVTSRAHQENNIIQSKACLPASQWNALQETNSCLERQLRELREEIMHMRMVPVGKAFERMRFVMHNLAAKIHKQVELEVYGENTELDKLMVEQMMDPLLHLVRNAISHGLEAEEIRIARNKPAAGKITLRAYTSGDAVIIEVEDDGQGIDTKQVMAHALSEEKEAAPNMNALLDILCKPGFSTQMQADQASGRGVGMDVVKNVTDELGGFLALETSPGKGTCFRIQLPMTLAIADALIISAGGQKFAVPLLSVREVFEVSASEMLAAENEHELMSYRDTALPLLRLADLFRLPEIPASHLHVLVVDSGLQTAGLVVDDILGNREIVVRTLRDPLTQVHGITGVGEFDGKQIALILDVNALLLENKKNISTAAPEKKKISSRAEKSGETPYLLFELAGTTYGISSRLVQQVEMLESITPVPNVPDFVEGIVLSRGQVIPAINPRLRFGLEKAPHDVNTRLAVINTGERMAGIVVDAATAFVTIHDSAIQPPPENTSDPRGRYLEGVIMLDGNMVFIPDIGELLDASS
ncbi:MAG: chemotaxis protein CheA [Gammaproteobacteria bacterium]|nr:chemotaxis protein CheA [Gammaproteobacteria bacterium]